MLRHSPPPRTSSPPPHFLVVAPFNPDDDTDRFVVEHPDDCSREEIDVPPGHGPAWAYTCAVGIQLDSEGIELYFRHADDPDVEPWSTAEPVLTGRHEIEAWSWRHPAGPWGGEEWDGGVRLVDEGTP